MSDTEMYQQDPLGYVNNVIGDLKQKNILDDTNQIGKFHVV